MAVTRLGLYGGPRPVYGSFAGKSGVEEPVEVGTGAFIVELASGGVFSVSRAADGALSVEAR